MKNLIIQPQSTFRSLNGGLCGYPASGLEGTGAFMPAYYLFSPVQEAEGQANPAFSDLLRSQ